MAYRLPDERKSPPEDFTELSIFPDEDYRQLRKEPFLRANKIHGPYEDCRHYLDVHFRLLREDYIRPFRSGIQEYKQLTLAGKERSVQSISELRFYRQVRILTLLCGNDSLEHLVQFDISTLKANWSACDFLRYGSIVCLSSDNFATLHYAVVTNSDIKQLKHGVLQICFQNESILQEDSSAVYTMAENTAFFEAYRHVLQGMKDIMPSRIANGWMHERRRNILLDDVIPMSSYIVKCKTTIKHPAYLTKHGRAVKMDLRHLFKEGTRYSSSMVTMTDPQSWPDLDKLELNSSQYEAIKTALTKEFAIIQGPPGTGKTYVGLKVTRVLLDNMDVWTPSNDPRPILVVCFTNHALDQFLEGILKFCPNGVIRVGSRSKSRELERFNLKNIRTERKNRRQVPFHIHNKIRSCYREMLQRRKCVETILDKLEATTETFVNVYELKSQMHFTHYEDFGEENLTDSLMQEWLRSGRMANQSIRRRQLYSRTNIQEVLQQLLEEDGVCDSDGDQNTKWKEYLNLIEAFHGKDDVDLDDEDAYKPPNYNKVKRLLSNIRKDPTTRRFHLVLRCCKAMTEEEEDDVVNVWELTGVERWRLYLSWLRRYQQELKNLAQEMCEAYTQAAADLQEARFEEDVDILINAKVVGMTTTGAARLRKVLKDVACPIVLVEEAAEILEAHVVTTLHDSCSHVILIGDHQQLRPKPTVHELSVHYHLDMSLFERLVENEVPHTMLSVQHRMRPEVSRLVRHVYPALQDHVSTLNRPKIKGVKHNVFLLHHEVSEKSNAETKSKSNKHEAELCVWLCAYLLRQDYEESSVTIITAYSGQVLEIKRLLKSLNLSEVHVTTIDGYQGEENDIIILSLVRNNSEGKVGFLKTDNRVCVAMSRARNGLYVLGNFKMLWEKSRLWEKIAITAHKNNQLGRTLPLQCVNHPESVKEVQSARDLIGAIEGWCQKPCTHRLPCKHVCQERCHSGDHKGYRCREPCAKLATCGKRHPCTKRCYEKCGDCMFQMSKKIPECGHTATMVCSQDPSEWPCSELCKHTLPCGHQCKDECHVCRTRKAHAKCIEKVTVKRSCGHKNIVFCYAVPDKLSCQEPCGSLLKCGHRCSGSCGECLRCRFHKPCKFSCQTLLPQPRRHSCKHTLTLPTCTEKCLNVCKHGACRQQCSLPCPPCRKPCPWKCDHQKNPCDSLCSNPCVPCKLMCLKLLPCQHRCQGYCGETCVCYTCNMNDISQKDTSGAISRNVLVKTALVRLPTCKHIFAADILDAYVKKMFLVMKPFDPLPCPTCATPINEWDCWRYHRLFRDRFNRQQESKKKEKG